MTLDAREPERRIDDAARQEGCPGAQRHGSDEQDDLVEQIRVVELPYQIAPTDDPSAGALRASETRCTARLPGPGFTPARPRGPAEPCESRLSHTRHSTGPPHARAASFHMIRNESRLRQIDLRWEREAYHDLSFIEALDIYARLWRQALRLNPDPIAGWREDLASDLAIARAVNGLPPQS